jgi:peptide/nickel transport system ATP-binding protein
MSTEHLLEVRHLSIDFVDRERRVHAVKDVSLTLDAGECLAVVGESGSGKSATARALIGLAGPTADVRAERLTYDGRDLSVLSESKWREFRGARIGFVLQDALSSLDPLRRIGNEVAEPLVVHTKLSKGERSRRVESLLHDVGIPEPRVRARQFPHELSGGLRQRALIASAIAAEPSVVIADEPTTALDVTVQAQVLDLLAQKRSAGTAVLLISHDLTVVGRLADRIAVMYAGLIVEEGPATDVLTRPLHPYTTDLLAAAPNLDNTGVLLTNARAGALTPSATGPGCPYVTRCPLADDHCRTELPPLADNGGSTTVRCWHAGEARDRVTTVEAAQPVIGDVLVKVEGISKRFRSPDGSWLQAVDNVSFELRAGEALGVVGESGSGKSTTAQIVLAMLAPDSGEVTLDHQTWSSLKERERRVRRPHMQVIYQDPLSSFDPRFTVQRIVGEALGKAGRRGAVANNPRIVELLAQVGLDESILLRRGSDLSGGQRQRVAIARALAPRPEIIVCDEPVSSLDVSIQAQILDLFTRLRLELGVSLLFISHDLGVIHQVCDRVIVMKDGCVVEEGDVRSVFSDPQHLYTKTLLSALPRVEHLAVAARS